MPVTSRALYWTTHQGGYMPIVYVDVPVIFQYRIEMSKEEYEKEFERGAEEKARVMVHKEFAPLHLASKAFSTEIDDNNIQYTQTTE